MTEAEVETIHISLELKGKLATQFLAYKEDRGISAHKEALRLMITESYKLLQDEQKSGGKTASS